MMGFGGQKAGVTADDHARLIAQIGPDDLMRYGFIPEFIGRLPVVVACSPSPRRPCCRSSPSPATP
jgi:ATP-dependent Clp protease ATP-binding subunit ClpX